MDNQNNINQRKGQEMKMRARTGDLIRLSEDAVGFFELEVGYKVKLMRDDLCHRTVRVLKARAEFTHDWPSDIPSTNLMLVSHMGQEYLVSREHRFLCLVAAEDTRVDADEILFQVTF